MVAPSRTKGYEGTHVAKALSYNEIRANLRQFAVEYRDQQLKLEDFQEGGPLTPFVGFVSFEFPEGVAFPCLPVPVEGSMIYPRTSGDARGVWAVGPEVWLALTLGATVTCQIGHFGRTLRDEEGTPSRLLRGAYKQLLDDRRGGHDGSPSSGRR